MAAESTPPVGDRRTGVDGDAAATPKPSVVTGKDVAREAGVHPSTVSRSLDPRTSGRVRAATRSRVLDVAERLGYRPNLTASSLRRQRSMTIGILVADLLNPVYGQLLRSITAQLDNDGYFGLILETPDTAGSVSRAMDILQARRVDGIICASSRAGDGHALQRAVEAQIPVVQTMRWTAKTGSPVVLNDDVQGGRLAAEHLIDLGHRRLLQLPGPTDTSSFAERSRGFRAAVESSGFEAVEHGFTATAATLEKGLETMRTIVDAGAIDGVTGVFAHNDLLAVGAIDALREAGLECPDDVSVVGYNDSSLADHLDPALSTIRMPVAEMGRLAARRMVQMLAGTGDLPDVITLGPELVGRDSTGAPPLPSVSRRSPDVNVGGR